MKKEIEVCDICEKVIAKYKCQKCNKSLCQECAYLCGVSGVISVLSESKHFHENILHIDIEDGNKIYLCLKCSKKVKLNKEEFAEDIVQFVKKIKRKIIKI